MTDKNSPRRVLKSLPVNAYGTPNKSTLTQTCTHLKRPIEEVDDPTIPPPSLRNCSLHCVNVNEEGRHSMNRPFSREQISRENSPHKSRSSSKAGNPVQLKLDSGPQSTNAIPLYSIQDRQAEMSQDGFQSTDQEMMATPSHSTIEDSIGIKKFQQTAATEMISPGLSKASSVSSCV